MNKNFKKLKSYLNENGLRFNLNEQRIWKYIEETFGENRARELKRLREEDNKVKFTSVEPLRKDPNRGMRFLRSCSNPINVGKLGSTRSFIKKKDKEYY